MSLPQAIPIAWILVVASVAMASAPMNAPAPRLFAPDVISTRDYERDGALTPDGAEFYYTKRTMWPYHLTLCVSRRSGGHWSRPAVAPFSGQYDDASPFVTGDGSKLYFASRRPIEGRRHPDFDLYVVHRRGSTWSAPERLPAPVNSTTASEIAPSLTASGVLYFTSIAATYRILRSRPIGDGWEPPEVVSDTTQDAWVETAAFVDPGERWLFEAIAGRDDAVHTPENLYPRADLYVRERHGDFWSEPRPLPPPINSAAEEGAPFLSPDGKRFFFMSERGPLTAHGGPRLTAAAFERILHAPGNGLGDLYEIDAARLGLRK